MLAALLPLYCFIGWEGAADLSEETLDPRAVTPFAMIRANYVSVAASLFMIVGFLIAIPHGTASLLSQPKNPLVYIFQSHFGAVAADVLQVVVFLAIFSCVLANMVVATRLAFALSRDKMLPASALLGRVSTRTRTPVEAACQSNSSARWSTDRRPTSGRAGTTPATRPGWHGCTRKPGSTGCWSATPPARPTASPWPTPC